MKVTNDNMTLESFQAWSGAIDTKKRILEEDMGDDFDNLIQELYPDGIDETHLNDLLRFEEDWIYESLGIKDEEDDTYTE